ncbi:FG-GAP repeat domain-containing protein [Chondromyces crocatus]|uniref:CARDB domain-containing protein n=1 Tax=Chondromyces crocatus TaxID=52 RepID=A0A0K1EEU0_CHOCO|nr:VCBS repeat-containing protein [Chondromyces crocatus]AKT39374.1 uncharacterized protein CMC5_035210 [Chondromyces crocatus]
MRRSILWLLVSPLAIIPACECGGEGSNSTTPGSGGNGVGGAGGAGGESTLSGLLNDGGTCTDSSGCEDGEKCVSGACCAADLACADTCCQGGQVCSFQQCQSPGSLCTDSSECAAEDYCEFSLSDDGAGGAGGAGGNGGAGGACTGGVITQTGRCLPRPPVCPDGQDPDPDNLTCIAACQVIPQTTSFEATLKYAWGGQVTSPYATDVMMSPIVIQLDDDDCDGKITDRDIPEIVFSTFSGGAYTSAGVLRAISVVEGVVVEKWATPGIVNATKHIAAGNIDGAPGNEVVGCAVDGTARAFRGDGTLLWTSAPMDCFMPSIADLDGDGTVEVIVEGGILNGATGALKTAFSTPLTTSFVVSDIDRDGKLDIVTGSQAFHADGTLFIDTGFANQSFFYGGQDWKSPWPAIGDLDRDGIPEVVVVDNPNHTLHVWQHDASQPGGFRVLRQNVDINGTIPASACPVGSWGNTHGGGPPTIADFTGDGYPDVAMAGGVGYAVFDGRRLTDATIANPDTLLWIRPTVDCSSASTGSTVFDFNGDGRAEVIYSDQQRLRIYDGPTGDVLFETCNTTATLIENPVVADVDNDGHADIVVVSNAYASNSAQTQCNDGVANGQSGVRIFGDPANEWVRTRRVWNEHAYHITNVGEDGSIPMNEAPNYLTPGLNNFRQNKQPGSEFAAPDAVVTIAPYCSGEYGLAATVRNVGEASLPAGVPVGFYSGTPGNGTLLGTLATTRALYPAEAEVVILPLPNASAEVKNGSIYAIVDDGNAPHPTWTECRTDNNVSPVVRATCNIIQ